MSIEMSTESTPNTKGDLIELHFIGRGDELLTLTKEFDNLCHNLSKKEEEEDGQNESKDDEKLADVMNSVTVIHGDSGVGKSTLVLKFLDDLKLDDATNHICLLGKNYMSENSKQLCAITTALVGLVSSLSEADYESLQENVLRVLGPTQLETLASFLPDLASFLTPPNKPKRQQGRRKSCEFPLQHRRSSINIARASGERETFLPRFSQILPRTTINLFLNLNSSITSVNSNATSHADVLDTEDELGISNPRGKNLWNRLKHILYSFIKAVMAMNRPVIMFIDDLQWADEQSKDLIKSLLADRSLSNFMFIFTCHENEDGRVDPKIKELFSVKDTRYINLDNLSQNDTYQFVLEALELDVETTKTLSEVIHKKTKGNVFLIKQSLEELIVKKALTFSSNMNSWEWIAQNISVEGLFGREAVSVETRMIHDCSTELQKALVVGSYLGHDFTKKTLQLTVSVETRMIHDCSTELQKALVVGSYLGHDFTKKTLQLVLENVGFQPIAEKLFKFLTEGVLQGMLVYSEETHRYYFAHDKIFEAASALLQHRVRMRKVLQGKVGKTLLQTYYSEAGEEWMLQVAANNINSSNTTEIDLVSKANMNLKVGTSLLSTGSYKSAEKFLEHGVKALKELDSHWTTEYDLSLLLFQNLVQTKLCLDEEHEGYKYAKEVLKETKDSLHKLNIYSSLANFETRKDKNHQALGTISKAVAGDLPKGRHRIRSLWYLIYIKRWYHHHSDDEILNLPVLHEESKHGKMNLFAEGFRHAGICGDKHQFLLLVVSGLRLSLRCGICPELARLFNACAYVALFRFNDYHLAMRFIKSSLKVALQFPESDVKSWLCFGYGTYFLRYRVKMDVILHLYQDGYRSGMEAGNLNSAALCRYGLIAAAFTAGYPLPFMVKCFEETINLFGIYSIQYSVLMIDEYRRISYYLTGQEIINWEDLGSLEPQSDIESDQHRLTLAYSMRLFLNVIFRKYTFARKMAKKLNHILKSNNTFTTLSLDITRVYFSFLLKVDLAHETGEKKRKKRVLRMANEINSMLRSRGDTNRHIELLIGAEVVVFERPKVEDIQKAYKEAVTLALEGGYTHFAAVSLESAGEHMLRLGEEEIAGKYFSQARDCYKFWGARAKVQQLEITRVAYIDKSSTESLSDYFTVSHRNYKFDKLALNHRVPEDETMQLLEHLHKEFD